MSKSEIVFVVTVILIVFGLSWFQLKDGERKTRDVQRKADVELVARKLAVFYSDHNYYPPASPSGEIVSCGLGATLPCKWGEDPIVDSEGVSYLSKLPNDPFAGDGRKYIYTAASTPGKVRIYIALERKQDKDIKKDLTVECGNHVQCNWYVED